MENHEINYVSRRTKMRKLIHTTIAAMALALGGAMVAAPASATLVGDTIQGTLNFGGFGATNFFDPANGFGR